MEVAGFTDTCRAPWLAELLNSDLKAMVTLLEILKIDINGNLLHTFICPCTYAFRFGHIVTYPLEIKLYYRNDFCRYVTWPIFRHMYLSTNTHRFMYAKSCRHRQIYTCAEYCLHVYRFPIDIHRHSYMHIF